MFRLSLKLALILMILGLNSCAQPEIDELSPPFKAKILASDNGFYQLQVVSFETLLDVQTVTGTLGSIEQGATISLQNDIGEIIRSENPEAIYSQRGESVRLDYYTKDGIIIPKNFASMEILGLYYAFEKTALFWINQLSWDPELTGYPSIYFNPIQKGSSSQGSTEVTQAMNAAYLAGVKDFFFFKTSRLEKVPVKMNFGVVAHEFSHFIFDGVFADFSPSVYDSDSVTDEFYLNALNEGLADFFSYVVTGSRDEFAASLDQLGEQRRLPVNWTNASLSSAVCAGSFYCSGSILASALYELSFVPSLSPVQLGLYTLEALRAFRLEWDQQKGNSVIDLTNYLNQLLLVIPGDSRDISCQVFLRWFDDDLSRSRLTC